jgi:type I restriction enzyme, S subunit
VESLVGSVPDGWLEVPLAKICDVVAGPSTSAFKAGKTNLRSVQVVTPKDLKHGRVMQGIETMIDSAAADRLARYRLSADDIVSVRTGDLGRHAIVEDDGEGWVVGTGCFRLRPQAAVDSRYLLYYLGHPAVRDWILRRASTATVPSLTTSALRTLPVVVPPHGMQTRVGKIMSAIDEKIAIHERIVHATQQLREVVLPLLLTQG